jgi:hypothetical protein
VPCWQSVVMSTAWDLTIDCAPSARAGSVLGSRTWLRRAASSRGVRELGKLGVPAGAYELPTAHAEVWSAVCSLPKRQQGDPNLQPLRGRRPLGSLRPEDRALDGRHGEDDQREHGQSALNDHEDATVTLVPDIAGEVPQPVDDDRF